jgi:hypothetical protein
MARRPKIQVKIQVKVQVKIQAGIKSLKALTSKAQAPT